MRQSAPAQPAAVSLTVCLLLLYSYVAQRSPGYLPCGLHADAAANTFAHIDCVDALSLCLERMLHSKSHEGMLLSPSWPAICTAGPLTASRHAGCCQRGASHLARVPACEGAASGCIAVVGGS
jgi:hypothetical protein